MRKNKIKIIKAISGIILGLGVLGGVIAITNHFVRKDEVSIHPTFEVGGLNANGKYEEDKTTLYTKEKFACEGLKATLDFDSTINYQIFYYDILDNFISSTDVLKEGYSGTAPLNGAYARIEITPINDEDGKISWTEKIKYSNMLNLKVAKNAEQNVKNKFVTIKGRQFQVVNNVLDNVFEYGIRITDDLEFIVHDGQSATTKTILSVEKYKMLEFRPLKLAENFGGSYFNIKVFQFAELPNTDSIYTTTNMDRGEQLAVSGANLYTLNFEKDTKYILISYQGSIDTSSTYTSLPECFTLVK
ncbi:MAG: hypothetical protein K2N64_01095 [Anaeroplasmataceae bacterium]|nr:hypothetical protein [Anaeroplasmataceae bacterium]